MDEHLVSATHAKKHGGFDAGPISKMWRIYIEASKQTLGFTTYKIQCIDDPNISRNYGTNNRMLWYKRIHDYFFMDTVFATKKAGNRPDVTPVVRFL